MPKPAPVKTSAVPTAPEGVDGAMAVRSASRGFTILALGAVVQPIVGQLVPPVGYVWLVIVAVVAFAAAAWSAGGTARPARQGMAGALGSYALMVPLVYMATGSVLPQQLVYTSLTAVVVGSAVGWWRGRRIG